MAAGLLVQVSGLEPPVSVSKLQVKHLKPKMKDFKIYHWLISFSCRINCRIPSLLSSAYNSLIVWSKMAHSKKFQNITLSKIFLALFSICHPFLDIMLINDYSR